MNLKAGKALLLICLLTALVPAKINYSGNTIKYQKKLKKVILSGKARVKNKFNILTADRIIVYQGDKYAEAHGNVRLVNQKEQITYNGGYLRYDYENEVCTAMGRPYIENKKDNITVRAWKIKGYMKGHWAYARSNVEVVFRDGANTTIIHGDRGYYYDKYKDFWMYGNVHMTNIDSGTNAVDAEMINYNFYKEEKFLCRTNVRMYSLEDDVEIRAGYVKYLPEKHYTEVKERPVLINKGENNSLAADMFERFDDKDLLYAKGNVVVETSENQKAYSAIARFKLDEKMALLWGNPRVEDAGNIFYCEQIEFDMDKDEFRMKNSIQGILNQQVD